MDNTVPHRNAYTPRGEERLSLSERGVGQETPNAPEASQPPQTCGALFLGALEHFTQFDADHVALFAAGFVTGQCEKVSLHACTACMFRSSVLYQEVMAQVVPWVAEHYGLRWTRLGEEWCVYRDSLSAATHIQSLHAMLRRPPPWTAWQWRQWHTARAVLCGVPVLESDPQYPLRTLPVCDQPGERPPCHTS